MRSALLSAWLLWLCCCSNAAEWYETLRPGVTRSEILKLVGSPSSSSSNVDIYAQSKGRIQCEYREAALRSAIYYDTPDGAAAWTLYATDGEPKPGDLAQRRAYLKAGDFTVVPEFSGKKVYTHKYGGTCYEVDTGFIVVEPIIKLGGGVGFFTNKAERVLWLMPDGAETVLYRAADHWQALKPPGLRESEVKDRKIKLKSAGDHLLKMNVTNVFGQADSFMGSGIDYRLFYLEDGLAVVSCDYPGGTLESINIRRPGLTNLTLGEWLSSQRNPARDATPPGR